MSTKEKKTKKKTIPKALRMKLWESTIGDKITGNCYCCTRQIKIDNFDAGHIIAEANGGQTTIENLKVICKPCNLSCGVQNLEEFKKTFGYGEKHDDKDSEITKLRNELEKMKIANEEKEKKEQLKIEKEEKYKLIKKNSELDQTVFLMFHMYGTPLKVDEKLDEICKKIVDDDKLFEQWNDLYKKNKMTNKIILNLVKDTVVITCQPNYSHVRF